MSNQKIVIDSKILVGKPILKGTRLAVEFILELLGNDWTYSQIIRNYPKVTKDGMLAAIKYSANILKDEKYTL